MSWRWLAGPHLVHFAVWWSIRDWRVFPTCWRISSVTMIWRIRGRVLTGAIRIGSLQRHSENKCIEMRRCTRKCHFICSALDVPWLIRYIFKNHFLFVFSNCSWHVFSAHFAWSHLFMCEKFILFTSTGLNLIPAVITKHQCTNCSFFQLSITQEGHTVDCTHGYRVGCLCVLIGVSLVGHTQCQWVNQAFFTV